jgi:hypothetical protein
MAITALLSPTTKFKVTTASGTPLVGGKVYTYLAGTTTLTATYADAEKVTTNTNPVILDARGEANIFLDPANNYKFVVQDSAGAAIYTQDNISVTPIGMASLAALSASSGAGLIGYIASGTGAIATTVEAKLRETVSIFEFMTNAQRADVRGGGGTIDVSGAFATAEAAITASRSTGASGIGYGSAYDLDCPPGIYLFPPGYAGFDAASYSSIIGQRAIFRAADNTTNFIKNIGYSMRFKGLGFVGGAKAMQIATGGVDTTTIDIEDCEFYNQLTSSIETNSASASTTLNIVRPKVFNTQIGTTVFKILSADKCTISGGSVTVAATLLQSGSTPGVRAVTTMRDMICTPHGGSTIWTANYGSLTLQENRFGGEAAATICDQHSSIDASDLFSLVIENNQVYCAGSYFIRFYSIPNIVSIRKNRGLVGTLGLLFDSSIPDLNSFRSNLASFYIDENCREELNFRGATEPMCRAITLGHDKAVGNVSLNVADKLAQFRSNTATGGAVSNVTVTNTTGFFGEPTRTYTGNNAAYDGSVSETWNNQLTGQPSGVYTAVYNCEVTSSHPVTISFFGAELDTARTLPKGKHVINVPFFWNSGTGTNRMGWSLSSLNSAQTIVMGNGRLFSGTVEIDTWNNVLYGAAAPITLQCEVGDRTIRVPQAVGQPKAWSCTTAGTPGTHTSEGNL